MFCIQLKLDFEYVFLVKFINKMYSIGQHNGVAKQLSNEWPRLLGVHCAAHRLALAWKDASEDVPYMATSGDHVEQLHLYFRNSANRSASLKAAAEVLRVCELKVKVNILNLK